jgi:alkylation response protein AidB-like acyl-CoA dehydrogenase
VWLSLYQRYSLSFSKSFHWIERDRVKLKIGVNVPAREVGIARAALDDTVEYTEQREQGERTISEFQGVRWEISEMATRVDTARLLTLRAASMADEGGRPIREYKMAKIQATQAAIDNANTAM